MKDHEKRPMERASATDIFILLKTKESQHVLLEEAVTAYVTG